MAGLKYGLLLGLIMFVMVRLVPQPAGSAILWLAVAMHLSFMAMRIWQRMHLPLVTTANILAATGSLFLAVVHFLGLTYASIPLAGLVPLGLVALAGPILFHIEARRHPEKWKAWEAAMRNSTVWDMLLGRHIPDLH